MFDKEVVVANRTGQLAARVDPTRMERIRYASALQGTSVSTFVVEAAYERAEQVIDEHHSTLVPSDYFDQLLAALDKPPRAIPELVAAARKVAEAPAFEQL
jgi:uncharacterized protein (DUF1778 family)